MRFRVRGAAVCFRGGVVKNMECFVCRKWFECTCFFEETLRPKFRSCSNRPEGQEGSRSQMFTTADDRVLHIHTCSIRCDTIASRWSMENVMASLQRRGIRVATNSDSDSDSDLDHIARFA